MLTNLTHETITRSSLNISFYPSFLNPASSHNILLELSTLDFSKSRRSNKTYGDDGLVYEVTFGGYGGRPANTVYRTAQPWSDLPFLKHVKKAVESATHELYNFCVIQCYPNGRMGINPHRDKEMVSGTTIAGLSLGATRELVMGAPLGSLRGKR